MAASTDLVSLANLKAYLGITASDEDTRLGLIVDMVSQTIEQRTGCAFGSSEYAAETYNGNGKVTLRLKRYPVQYISKLSVARQNAVDITNVSATSGAGHAYVEVRSGSLLLTLVGGDNAGTDTLVLSTYATLTALVAAIDGLGKGWDATADDADCGSYPATDLLDTGGRLYALDETVDLDVPEEPLSDFRLDDADAGIVYYAGGFPSGVRNIVVTYTAGYTTVPADIQQAACVWAATVYNRAKEGADGFKSENITDLTQTYAHDMPPDVKAILERRQEIVA